MSRTTHGMSDSMEFRSWTSMMQRCNNPNNHKYPLYGGRGIKVCKRWYDFSLFYADMGDRPSIGHSIERLDTNGDYRPGNCVWATPTQQNNNRNIVRKVDLNGEQLTIRDLIYRFGSEVDHAVVGKRIFQRGWSIQDALTIPVIEAKGRTIGESGRQRMRLAQRLRKDAKRFPCDGQMLTTAEILALKGGVVDLKTAHKRMVRGWSVEDAINTPLKKAGIYHGGPKSGPLRHSDETKAKISAAQRNRVRGPVSEETRRKMSLARSGQSHMPESIEKMRQAKIGHAVSAETRAKISASNKGRPISEETKAKMRLAQQRRRERERD